MIYRAVARQLLENEVFCGVLCSSLWPPPSPLFAFRFQVPVCPRVEVDKPELVYLTSRCVTCSSGFTPMPKTSYPFVS